LVEKQSRKNEFLAPTSTSPWAHRVYNIVVRNWNILIFVGHLERRAFTGTLLRSLMWVGPVLSCFHTCVVGRCCRTRAKL